jgi:hypothetical protein
MSSTLSVRAGFSSALPQMAAPAAAFLAGLGPVVMLGFSGGGYDAAIVAGYGVVLWWLLFIGVLSGALPRPRPTAAGVVVLAAITLLAGWGAISLGWSASEERGLTEIVRLVVLGGSVLLGMVVVAAGHSRALVGGVLCGLVVVMAAGVLARLQPDLFPGSQVIADDLGIRRRMSWPLNYWNAMGSVAACALPLGLCVAARARSVMTSALAAAGLPVVALGLVLTISRGGSVAAVVGLAAAVLLVAPRLVVLRTAIAPAIGSAVLIAATLDSEPIREAVGGSAQSDAGAGLIPLVLLVTAGVGFVQAGWHLADDGHWTPQFPRPSRAAGSALAAGLVVVALVIALAAGAPDRLSNGWDEFKNPDVTALNAQSGSVSRLTAANSAGRYEQWSGAIRAFRDNPAGGIGLGSWDAWWSPRRVDSPPIRNAHSEPLEIAAELGVPGIALFLAIVLLPIALAVALLRLPRADPRRYGLVAAPTMLAFAVAISVDWSWQLSTIPVAVGLLYSTTLGRATQPVAESAAEPAAAAPKVGRIPTRLRAKSGVLVLVAVVVLSVGSIGTLAIAMVAPEGVSRSAAAVDAGRLSDAAAEARDAAKAAPFSLDAALQRALVAEQRGDLSGAARAARIATTVEPRNWRPWMVLARIEASRNRPKSAVEAYRRAKVLNPRSKLVTP